VGITEVDNHNMAPSRSQLHRVDKCVVVVPWLAFVKSRSAANFYKSLTLPKIEKLMGKEKQVTLIIYNLCNYYIIIIIIQLAYEFP
jgi:hypothetical protein